MDGSQRKTWRQDCTLSVAAAIREAMESPRPSVESPHDLPSPPMPHLPLRKRSAEKLQAKRAPPPKPLWASSDHALRGFSPSPVHAMPQVDTAPASSEHAFASKDENRKRPFKSGLGELAALSHHPETELQPTTSLAELEPLDGTATSRPPSSPLLPTPPASPRTVKSKSLRPSRSVGDGLKSLRNRFSSPNEAKPRKSAPFVTDEIRSSVPMPLVPAISAEGVRDSFRSAVNSNRSAVTSNASALNASSILTEPSTLTPASSHASDVVHIYPNWPTTTPEAETDDEMTVEDAIGMYAAGFDTSTRPSMDTEVRRSFTTPNPRQDVKEPQHDLRPSTGKSEEHKPQHKRPKHGHRRSQSASLLDHIHSENRGLAPRGRNRQHTFSRILAVPTTQNGIRSVRDSTENPNVPRDRYGFKKASLHVTVQQYDEWNVEYSQHLQRRSKKWHTLMQSYGLSTDEPFRFPPKSDKIKRYIRKGIPPEFRGAAWFWYAGGPSRLAKEPGLYQKMLQRAQAGELSDSDKEHIERDLNRTFPDNIRFKPDPVVAMDAPDAIPGDGDGSGIEKKQRKKARHSVEPPETPMLQSLRRVLQAFAVHNPHIGYCQSLNFIAGLLLLFLDQDEEKAFILMNIITTIHLPGTHGVALEGANIDIAVLMSCIKDCLPTIWNKLDDNGGAPLASNLFPGARMPTVSLATTAWFMSIYVGTLPIECVLRIWDCLFFEGSKTLFRVALAIFKFGEKHILSVSDPMEIFQVVQTLPRSMLDVNALLEVCFRRRGGFGHVSQGLIEGRREERRKEVREGVASIRDGRMSVWKKVKTRVA